MNTPTTRVITDLCTCNRPQDTVHAVCLACGKPVHLGTFHQRWHTGPRWQCATCREIETKRTHPAAEQQRERG